jgi:hypothetical protein
MKASILCAPLLGLLVACSSQQPQPTLPTQPVSPPNTAEAMPKAQLQKPAEVLAEVLKNYNETIADCREFETNKARGYYYCSGVLVRTVDDGDFEPWMYSPTAIEIGATSYSWIRRDVSQTQLYHPAGFILRNRIDAISHALPGLETGFICLYPFDASTGVVNGHQGCGYRGRRTAEPSQAELNVGNSFGWGSCEGIGVNSEEKWNNHFRSTGQNTLRQCSWHIESQWGWKFMIGSRRAFPALSGVWNEILLNNLGDGGQMPKYIAAFFYDVKKTGGLAAARHFQTKMNSAGYNVPILRLGLHRCHG